MDRDSQRKRGFYEGVVAIFYDLIDLVKRLFYSVKKCGADKWS